MAATVAEVAVSSAVEHVLNHAVSGGFSEGSSGKPSKPDVTYQQPWETQLLQQKEESGMVALAYLR